MKTGLILEGGAMRGIFTAGVLDVFMENEISFDGAVGVSAGAVFGCNLKSRQPGRVIRYNKRFALPLELDLFDCATYDANPMEFHLSVTDCETGKPVYRLLDRADETMFRWMRASASMPLVSRPVEIDGRCYLDGGLSDGIPLAYFESIGYDRNVVITTRPQGYRKFPSWKFVVLKPFFRRFPAVYRALKTRHVWYNETLRYIDGQVAAGKAFLICPDAALPISRVCHNPETMQKVYDIGRATAERLLPRVKAYIGQGGF